jgi:membrane protease YdiL (CAAX protease family)
VTWIAAAFWNCDEQRLRALWRLLLQFLMFLLALLVCGSIGLILPQTPLLDWIARVGVLVIAIVTVWLACRMLDLRSFADLGLRLNRAWWIDLAGGLVLGALLMTAVFGVALAAGWIECRAVPARSAEFRPLPLALFLLFVSYVAVAFGEEILFRGYHLRNVAEGLSCRWVSPRAALWLSAVLTAALFAAAHSNHEDASMLSRANTALAGMLLATTVICTGRLALPIGFHITWNFFQGGVYGFPVSGDEFHVALLTTKNVGPTLWTGGAYGPEGGLLATAAYTAGILLSLVWISARHGPLRVQTDWAEYPFSTRIRADGHHCGSETAQAPPPHARSDW